MMVFLTMPTPNFHHSASVHYRDLVLLYCGANPRLPPDLCMLCLKLAGLCAIGKRRTFYWIYF